MPVKQGSRFVAVLRAQLEAVRGCGAAFLPALAGGCGAAPRLRPARAGLPSSPESENAGKNEREGGGNTRGLELPWRGKARGRRSHACPCRVRGSPAAGLCCWPWCKWQDEKDCFVRILILPELFKERVAIINLPFT